MTHATKNLNVLRVRSLRDMGGVWVIVMAMQIIRRATHFAFPARRNYISNNFSSFKSTFGYSAIPFRMFIFTHISSATCRKTWNGAIDRWSAVSLPSVKCFAAFFARVCADFLLLSRTDFLRARTGTGVCFPADMCVRSGKIISASSACERAAPLNGYNTLEPAHV